ncbi:hypothetical protein MT390_02345 [Vibrio sp. 2-Bac 85]
MLDISLLMAMHMLIGSVVVFSGAIALLLSKGSSLHKLAGRFFVSSIILMGTVIVAEAWYSPGSISPLGILFVFFMVYLVVTAWSTIHRSEATVGTIDILAPVVALCISIAGLIMRGNVVNIQSQAESLPPNDAYFFFSALAFMSMILDVNNLKKGGVQGKHRIIRHIWRMSCCLFFAISSLFTGPGSIIFPESARGNYLLSIPQLLVVIFAIYWISRLLFLKNYRKNITIIHK